MNIFLTHLSSAFNTFYEALIENIPNLLSGLIIFLFFGLLGRILRHSLTKGEAMQSKRRTLYGRLVESALIGLGLFLAISISGVNLTGILTGLGLAAVGITLSFQDIISNFVAGIELLSSAPFEIGDYLVVGEARGEVTEIGARATFLKAHDSTTYVVPNRELLTKTLQVVRQHQGSWLTFHLEVNPSLNLGAFISQSRAALEALPGVVGDSCRVSVRDISSRSAGLRVQCQLKKQNHNRQEIYDQAHKLLFDLATTLKTTT